MNKGTVNIAVILSLSACATVPASRYESETVHYAREHFVKGDFDEARKQVSTLSDGDLHYVLRIHRSSSDCSQYLYNPGCNAPVMFEVIYDRDRLLKYIHFVEHYQDKCHTLPEAAFDQVQAKATCYSQTFITSKEISKFYFDDYAKDPLGLRLDEINRILASQVTVAFLSKPCQVDFLTACLQSGSSIG